MTLSSLSLRNAKRQTGDYLVYFVSIVIVAALIYAFNGLVFSQELQSLSSRFRDLSSIIISASIVVIFIMSWLVSYTINFMLTQRSREFGTYLLIGVENKQIARMFFMENLAVGGCALALGLLLGNLLFQMLRAIVFALFGTPYHFSFFFPLKAVGLTLFYFVLIYLLAQMKSRKRIRRMKIYDLIYYEKKNEEEALKASPVRRWIFTISIALGIIGTVLIMAGSLSLGFIGAGCIIAFLYGFFLSFASGVPAFFHKHPTLKYKRQNLLVFRTLASKLSTMGIIMATISMLLVATIISEGMGMIFRGIFAGRATLNGCFDILLSAHDTNEEVFTASLDYIEKNIPIKANMRYQVYLAETSKTMEYIESRTSYYRHYQYDTVMRESDYIALRAMLGYPPVTLTDGQYLIHCQPYIEKVLKDWNQNVILGGKTLTLGGLYTETFAQHLYDVNGNGFILVVPDQVAEDCPVSHTTQVFLTQEKVTEDCYNALFVLENEIMERIGWHNNTLVYIKAAEDADAAAWTAMTVFPLYYLALVLTITAATILTIQQLSETGRYRRQFLLLQKLGMEQKEMQRSLRTQFAIYYAMPAVPPVLIGVPVILNTARIVEPGTLIGASRPAAVTGISLGLFFLVYAIYILMAYTSLKKNVLPT
ncbi:ABC transporter permease [Parablautia muri]|uniref:ABC transporter permease n=1 Tax=Parablautia muri TaxID=2320879 RepID=UPI002ED319D8